MPHGQTGILSPISVSSWNSNPTHKPSNFVNHICCYISSTCSVAWAATATNKVEKKTHNTASWLSTKDEFSSPWQRRHVSLTTDSHLRISANYLDALSSCVCLWPPEQHHLIINTSESLSWWNNKRFCRRWQTSPPVPPPRGMDETHTSSLILAHLLHNVKTWPYSLTELSVVHNLPIPQISQKSTITFWVIPLTVQKQTKTFHGMVINNINHDNKHFKMQEVSDHKWIERRFTSNATGWSWLLP